MAAENIVARYEQQEQAKRDRNRPLLDARMESRSRINGPRVGDYIRLPDVHPKLEKWTRITHHWGDFVQTGGKEHGSFYIFSGGGLSYSGALDPGISADALIPTGDTKDGAVWLFDEGRSGAGRDVTFMAPMRVFRIKDGADLSGIWELHTPFRLDVFQKSEHTQYPYCIRKHGMAYTACHTVEELHGILRENGLCLTAPPTESQRLNYAFEG